MTTRWNEKKRNEPWPHTNEGKPWKRADEIRAHEMRLEGVAEQTIAQALYRSWKSVNTKLFKMLTNYGTGPDGTQAVQNQKACYTISYHRDFKQYKKYERDWIRHRFKNGVPVAWIALETGRTVSAIQEWIDQNQNTNGKTLQEVTAKTNTVNRKKHASKVLVHVSSKFVFCRKCGSKFDLRSYDKFCGTCGAAV